MVGVTDTTGAGDTFAGALLAARLAGNDWPEATVAAQEAAATHLRAIAAGGDKPQVKPRSDPGREAPEPGRET